MEKPRRPQQKPNQVRLNLSELEKASMALKEFSKAEQQKRNEPPKPHKAPSDIGIYALAILAFIGVFVGMISRTKSGDVLLSKATESGKVLLAKAAETVDKTGKLRDDFAGAAQKVDALNAQDKTQAQEATAKAGPQLYVTSVPDGAALFVDGKNTGQRTPAAISVQRNQTLNLSIRREGYSEFSVMLDTNHDAIKFDLAKHSYEMH